MGPERPLSIAFVNSTRKWGGVKSWMLDFGSALRERGHRILALVREGTPFVDACRSRAFETFPLHFGPKYNPVAIARVIGIFRRERPDVTVVNISRDLEVGAVAARLLRVPVLHRVGLLEDFRNTLEERIQHRLLVDAVLVPAEWMKEGLLAALPWLHPEELHAIPNSKALPSVGRTADRDRAPLMLGTTSQLSPSKGHTHLLQAVQLLAEKGMRVQLKVAGAGPMEEHLREETATRGLADAVQFVGFLDDVRSFLQTLDVFVLPSLKEGFPNALLEAMAEGLPVVAFDLEGVREMADGAGLLVKKGDSRALAQALADLSSQPLLRERMALAARERVAERFDLGRNALRLENLLMELVTRCGARR